jgi:hypothetical protein
MKKDIYILHNNIGSNMMETYSFIKAHFCLHINAYLTGSRGPGKGLGQNPHHDTQSVEPTSPFLNRNWKEVHCSWYAQLMVCPAHGT